LEIKSAQVAYLSSGWRAKIEGSSESDSGLVDMPPHQFAHLKVVTYAPNCAFENRVSLSTISNLQATTARRSAFLVQQIVYLSFSAT